MFRSLRKSIRYLILAALLLVMMVCAVEVGLRCRRAMAPTADVESQRDAEHPWVVPSATSYIELQPGGRFAVQHPDTDQELTLRLNSQGLRGGEIAIPKPEGVLRILCIGDETTLAAGVEEQATYASLLQQHLGSQSSQPIEVINAGINQSCPLLASLHLKQRWLALQPDLIILHFDMTDVGDDHRLRPWVSFDDDMRAGHATHPLLRQSGKQEWQTWEDEFLVVEWGTHTLWDNWSPTSDAGSRVDINTRAGSEAWLRDDPPNWDNYIRHALAPIVEMKSIAEGSNCRFMLTTTPRPWQASAKASPSTEARHPCGIGLEDHYGSRRPFEILARFAEQEHIPFLDCSLSFVQYAAPEALYLVKSPELSDLGHQLYAYELAGAVMQLVPGVWTTAESATPWADN
jgi:hypothetical protein